MLVAFVFGVDILRLMKRYKSLGFVSLFEIQLDVVVFTPLRQLKQVIPPTKFSRIIQPVFSDTRA